MAFQHGDHLFLGEAAGTYSTLGKGPDTTEYYLRPATPPRFFPDVYRDSVERLLALDPLTTRLLFAHHGEHTGDPHKLLTAARDQLDLWVTTVDAFMTTLRGLSYSEQPENEEALMAQLRHELAVCDPIYARGAELPDDIRERERDFTRQTLRGILGHLKG